MPTPKTKMREGLDLLLGAMPNAEVVRVARQTVDDDAPDDAVRGPWTEVDLAHGDRPHEVVKYAIWNLTGHVYQCDEHGAVGDDPVITV